MCKFVPLHVDIFISFFMVMVFNYFLRLILSNNFSLRKLLQLLTYGIRSFQVRDLKIFEPILWRFEFYLIISYRLKYRENSRIIKNIVIPFSKLS